MIFRPEILEVKIRPKKGNRRGKKGDISRGDEEAVKHSSNALVQMEAPFLGSKG